MATANFQAFIAFLRSYLKNDTLDNLKMTADNIKKPSDDLDALLDGKTNDFAFGQFVVLGSI